MKLLVMMSYVYRPLVRQLLLSRSKELGAGMQITWAVIQVSVTGHSTSHIGSWSPDFTLFQSLSSLLRLK